MKLNSKLSEELFKSVKKLKAIGSLPMVESDIANLFYTTNAINALSFDAAIVDGKYLISDYEIDERFADMIVPSRIRMCSDTYALDVKAETAYAEANNTNFGKVLSPEEYKIVWAMVVGSRKQTFKASKVSDKRVDKTLADMEKVAYSGDTCRLGTGHYVPVQTKINIYQDRAYTEEVDKTFTEWWDDVLLNMGTKQPTA